MKRHSTEGRFAERVVSGFDDRGVEERIVIWIERKEGGVWAVGRAVNPQHRPSDEPRPGDYLFEGYELQEVVAGEVQGRVSDEDVVLFKSNGLAAWDVAIAAVALERARERRVGREI